MSALAQQHRIFPAALPLGELEITRQISRVAAQAINTREALDEIAALVLRIEGIRWLHIDHRDELRQWGLHSSGLNEGSATADIAWGGSKWGQLRIGFNLRLIHLDSPLRFTRFVGEQMAGVIDRLGREKERVTLLETVEQLRSIMASRKVIERAKGIVANRQQITTSEAGTALRKYSRDSGLDLKRVAEAVILSEQAGQDDACFRIA